MKLKSDEPLSKIAFDCNLRRYSAAYPLEALLDDCRRYKAVTGRRVTFEYTLLAGENDSPEQARALGKLLRSRVGRGSHVNLLPWNPVAGAEDIHSRPSKSAGSSHPLHPYHQSPCQPNCRQPNFPYSSPLHQPNCR